MRLGLSRLVLVSFVAGCSGSSGQGPGASTETGGAGGDEGIGGSATGGRSGGTGGKGTGGADGAGAGGTPGADAATAPDARSEADASQPRDGLGVSSDGPTQGPDSGPIDLEGWIPPYQGPPVGPEVKMDCPGDPTEGFTEYKDNFRVEHPYDLPVTARFSIVDGIYNFWVQQGDKRHNPNSTARHPRTEARYSQNFRTGIRMFSADVFWEKSVSRGTIVMQVHTTTTGIGPVYMVANGNNVSPIDGSKVPGGLFDRWINLKVEINSATTGSRYWVNNCLVATKGSGTRGDGNNYFKMGVYHCDSGTCRDRYKNVKLYMK